MKKILVILLSLVLLISLSSCSSSQADSTVKNIQLTKEEQRIANLTSDIIQKFSFRKDKTYDINMYLYKDGVGENVGGVYGIDTEGKDGTIFVSGSRTGNAGFTWSIFSGNGVFRTPAYKADEFRTFTIISGAGPETIEMEKGKEYVLVFAAFKEGDRVSMSSADLFSSWELFEDKSELTSKYDYVYVITVCLSDMPGNK